MTNESELLDRYHDGSATEHERARFEAMLAGSEELSAELALQRQVDDRLRALFGAPARVAEPVLRPRRALFPAFAAAAAAMLVLFWRGAEAPELAPPACGTWSALYASADPTAPRDGGAMTACSSAELLPDATRRAFGRALVLPERWIAYRVELATGPAACFWVTDPSNRHALLVVRAGAPTRAPELGEGWSAERREIAGLECVEIAKGPTIGVVGALRALRVDR